MNDEGRLSGKLEALPRTTRGFWLAGCPQGDGSIGEHFDGKIDQPSLGRDRAMGFLEGHAVHESRR